MTARTRGRTGGAASATRRPAASPIRVGDLETERVRRSSERRAKARETASRAAQAVGSTSGMLLAFTVFLALFGLVMVLSASTIFSLDTHGSAYTVFIRQVVWVALGFGALFALASVDYRKISARQDQMIWLLAGCAVLLVLVLVPGLGVSRFGSTRWIGLGPLNVQPSEFAKLAFVLAGAAALTRRETLLHDPTRALVPLVFPMLAGIGLLVMLEPDLGTTIVFGVLAVALLYLAGVRLRLLGALGAVALSGVVVLILMAPYRLARVRGVFDPLADPGGDGYQVVQSIIALTSGGWTGTGLGGSRQKWSFLPNAHNDFVFSIVGEELGLLGALVVLVLTFGLVLYCARASRRAPDTFGRLVAGTVGAWIGVQALMNIGAVIGLLPITGVVLPLVSQGGTSALVMLAAIGIVVSIARAGDRSAEHEAQVRRRRAAVRRKARRA